MGRPLATSVRASDLVDSLSSTSGSVDDEPIEQPAMDFNVLEQLGMPLHGDNLGMARDLERLDHSVRRPSDRPHAAPWPRYRLVMQRVDLEEITSDHARQRRRGVDLDVVARLKRPRRVIREVLHQRSTEGDVQDLCSSADREQR